MMPYIPQPDPARDVSVWREALNHKDIRLHESLLPASRENGGRLRGIEIAPGYAVARDHQIYVFYEGRARPLTDREVVDQLGPASHLQSLFRDAVARTRAARRRRAG